jgi:hypothetical protein
MTLILPESPPAPAFDLVRPPLGRAANEALDEYADSLRDGLYDFYQLTRQLASPIRRYEFDSVIADEVSGHYPALFVHHLMKRWNTETGAKIPARIGVASGQIAKIEPEAKGENIALLLSSRRARLGEKTLIVTDLMATGRSVNLIASNLPRGVMFDVATLSDNITMHARQRYFADAHFYSGASYSTSLHGRRQVTGRDKDKVTAVAFRRQDYDPQLVKAARDLTLILADKMYDGIILGHQLGEQPVDLESLRATLRKY